jgi:hypothetical protein
LENQRLELRMPEDSDEAFHSDSVHQTLLICDYAQLMQVMLLAKGTLVWRGTPGNAEHFLQASGYGTLDDSGQHNIADRLLESVSEASSVKALITNAQRVPYTPTLGSKSAATQVSHSAVKAPSTRSETTDSSRWGRLRT